MAKSKKQRNASLPAELKKLKVKHLLLSGYGINMISRELNMSHNTVMKYVDEVKEVALAEMSVQLEKARKETFAILQEAYRATFKKLIDEPHAKYFPAMARIMLKATGLDQPPLEREDVEDMVRERVEIEVRATLKVFGVADDVIRNHTNGNTKGP